MDRHSIFDGSALAPARGALQPTQKDAVEATASGAHSKKVLFPGEDAGRSLNQMAERDLDAMLQLLAERAQYITGASGAAIALREGDEIVCRASAGSSAPEIGAHLAVDSGLSGESIRTKQVLRCNDAATDTRVNRESCEALGIASVVVMPLMRDEEVNGVFELLSDRTSAFEERDLAALERLGEMVQTALDHVAAARRTAELEKNLTAPPVAAEDQEKVKEEQPLVDWLESTEDPQKSGRKEKGEAAVSANQWPGTPLDAGTEDCILGEAEAEEPLFALEQAPAAMEIQAAPELPTAGVKASLLKKCTACGFPVSEGRTLCLDCEKKEKARGAAAPHANASSEISGVSAPLFSMGVEPEEEGSWLSRHRMMVVIGAVVVVIVVVLMVLR